jgi:hypothetical protein
MAHTPGPWTLHVAEIPYVHCGEKGPTFGPVVMAGSMEEMMADARLIAAAPDMYDLIEKFGDAVTNMFEQMMRGHWTDDHGHDVQRNTQMAALKPLIIRAISLRVALRKAEGA